MMNSHLSNGVILDLETLDRGDIQFCAIEALIPELTTYPNTTTDELDQRLTNMNVVLTNKVVLDAKTLKKHPDIKLICVLATGTNNVDLEAAAKLGIEVKNVKAYGTPSVVQHVYSLILALARSQFPYHRAVESGQWSSQDKFCLLDHPITDLSDKTLGIVGYGELGRNVADVAPAFGMNVMVAERADQQARDGRFPLKQVFAESDILSLHCPLTPDTDQLVNQESLALMKPSAWLINTARGGLVNEDDLAHALDNGIIAAAALDVLSTEPPPANHPLLEKPRDNLFITPHIAWATSMARQKIVDLTAENIKEFLDRKSS